MARREGGSGWIVPVGRSWGRWGAVVGASGGKIRIRSSGREGAERERRWEKEEEQRMKGGGRRLRVYVSEVTVAKCMEGVKVGNRRRMTRPALARVGAMLCRDTDRVGEELSGASGGVEVCVALAGPALVTVSILPAFLTYKTTIT